jgi:hypothetical protein
MTDVSWEKGRWAVSLEVLVGAAQEAVSSAVYQMLMEEESPRRRRRQRRHCQPENIAFFCGGIRSRLWQDRQCHPRQKLDGPMQMDLTMPGCVDDGRG